MKSFYFWGLGALALSACEVNESTNLLTVQQANEILNPWTQAPLKCLEQPFETLEYVAQLAQNWVLSNGTRIELPAHAFYDAQGNLYEGKVAVQYRNFNSASEIIRSGIPMEYENGIFESAGMFEIRAKGADGTLLALAPDKSLNIHMPSDKVDTNYNFYAFDENKGQWIADGKPETILNSTSKNILEEEYQNTHLPQNTPFKLSETTANLKVKSILSYDYYPLNEADYPKLLQYIKKGLSPELIVRNDDEMVMRFGHQKEIRVYPVVSEIEKKEALALLKKLKKEKEIQAAIRMNDIKYLKANDLIDQNGEFINAAANSYRRVEITNLGIYNCDRLREFRENMMVHINNVPLDGSGRAFLVFNKSGAQTLTPSKQISIALDPNQDNALFVIFHNKLWACKLKSGKQDYDLEPLAEMDEYFTASDFDSYVASY